MRIVFMGTPDFAVPTLTEIVSASHDVVAVYTRAPKPAGRGQAERKSAVHVAAEGFGIPVLTPKSLRKEAEQIAFAAFDADVAVVVAYGLILPKPILDAPRIGCLNLHGSLLPRWRGAAPIQRAVLAGDARTGLMVMRMDEGLDTGPVALADEMPITPDMTTGELHDKMMLVGADLMGRALAALERGSLTFTPQPEAGVTYASKIDKAEARIDWSKPAAEVHNLIRGMSPFPGAWFELELGGAPVRVKALRSTLAPGASAPRTILPGLTIACGDGAVRLISVQREGKGAMDAAAFLRGAGEMPHAGELMPRYKLIVEYDGTPFAGWQRQAGDLSVQQVLEEAIGKMSGETVTVQAAGRTDSGVHALGQVVSFDLSKDWDAFKIREALNFHTKPHPVAIVAAEAAPDDFEARFSATARHYEYRILNRRGRPALDEFRVWHCPMTLDAEAMHAAAQLILGKHDFTTFRSAECQAKLPVKTLDRLDVTREGEMIVVRASARSFLHSQVRSMVGSLKLVGEGKWTARQFRAALDAKDRARCGPLAPPEGLYLVRVDYDALS